VESNLSYPIGGFETPASVSAAARDGYVSDIEAAPRKLREAVANLNARQLDTPYRPGGWTVRQVVHHLADSHLNAYARFRLALTEDAPAIRTYEEARWAELPDAKTGEVEMSLSLLDAIHARWLTCIRALPTEAFDRVYRHPEMGVVSLNQQLALYAWHGKHHVTQITSLAQRSGW
jgi:uncharacterized damage-inducible protein DinB